MRIGDNKIEAIRRDIRDAYDSRALSAGQISRLEEAGFDFVGRGSTPIIELKSGRVLGSLAEAARFAGAGRKAVYDAISEKRLLNGCAFAYADGNLPDIGEYREPRPTGGRKVVELGSGKVFGSLIEAAGFAGVVKSGIYDAIAKKRLVGGYAFAYSDGELPDIGEYRESARGAAKRQVIELGSGKVFGSVAEIARFAGVSDFAIRKAIGEKRLLKGYAFAYADSELPDIVEYREPRLTGGRKVVELGSGKVFGSLKEAARYAEVSDDSIRNAIVEKRLLKGYAFAYADDSDITSVDGYRR